jgi:hypothetical protein
MKILPIAIHALIVLFILLFTFAPVFSVAYAASVAEANNCELDEGSVHPCIVDGEDIGETLYTLGMMGWFMLVTIPVGLLALFVYIVGAALFYGIRWYVRRKKTAAAAV